MMIIKTSQLSDAIKRVSKISTPRFKFENDSAVNAFAKTLILVELFADQKILEVKCIGDAQVFSEFIDVTPEIGEESFAAVVYPNTLLDVIKSGDSLINVSELDNQLIIKINKKLVHKLKSQERALDYFAGFTTKPPRIEGSSFKVNAIDFRTALSYCLHAVGDRFEFIVLRAIDNTIWMAGTDGFRAAFVNDIAEYSEDNININIGVSEARRLLAIIPNDEVDIMLLVAKNKLYLSFENFSSSTLLTNTSMDIFEVLRGKEKPTHAVFKADLDFFVKAISFLSSMSAEGAGRACIAIDKGSVKMSTVAQQVGDTTWTMTPPEGNFPEERLELNFNSDFIRSYLSAVKPSELSVCLGDNPRYPVFLESENKNQIFLFMPMQ